MFDNKADFSIPIFQKLPYHGSSISVNKFANCTSIFYMLINLIIHSKRTCMLHILLIMSSYRVKPIKPLIMTGLENFWWLLMWVFSQNLSTTFFPKEILHFLVLACKYIVHSHCIRFAATCKR